MTRLSIVDYGLGNLRSVKKALEKTQATIKITKRKEELATSDGLVIPGVGAFEDGIRNLGKYKSEIFNAFESGKPILGICLGMQLSLTKSYEGNKELNGLDIIKGEAISLPTERKVPHIGWNNIKIKGNHPIFEDIRNGEYFYFVHSYYANTKFEEEILAECEYGIRFPAAISKENYIGVQFHPEKSGEKGLKLLKNFGKICKS